MNICQLLSKLTSILPGHIDSLKNAKNVSCKLALTLSWMYFRAGPVILFLIIINRKGISWASRRATAVLHCSMNIITDMFVPSNSRINYVANLKPSPILFTFGESTFSWRDKIWPVSYELDFVKRFLSEMPLPRFALEFLNIILVWRISL